MSKGNALYLLYLLQVQMVKCLFELNIYLFGWPCLWGQAALYVTIPDRKRQGISTAIAATQVCKRLLLLIVNGCSYIYIF
jgi:hypothetical protein